MNADDAIEIRNKADRYEKLAERKSEVAQAIQNIHKNGLERVRIGSLNNPGGLNWEFVSDLKDMTPYTQITLDYLNMLYEQMTYDQSQL